MKIELHFPAVAFAPCLFWLLSASAVGCGDLSPDYPEGPKAANSAGATAAPAAGGAFAVEPPPGSMAGSAGAAGATEQVDPPQGNAAGSLAVAGQAAPAAGSGGISAAGGGGAGRRAPPAPPSGPGAVGRHGTLRVEGNRIVDALGEPVQLRGMSLFWSQWSNYYAVGTVDQLADDWQSSVVRAALGVENGGYLQSQAANEAKVVTVVDRAIERGMYVIIDWHDHNAMNHQDAAVAFFTRMAQKYGSSPAVIFEIFNEPLEVPWASVKAYAETVIGAIRGAGATNLVIVGTPTWSQDVDAAAENPISAFDDVAYTLHFYAATHKQWLRDKAARALDAGIALFVTEWGTCESSGNGAIDMAETTAWLDFMAQNQISWLNWALNDKAESCSALAPGAGTSGPWTGNALTTSGALVKPQIP